MSKLRKGKLKLSILLSFFTVFTYFGFGTFELYAGNKEEFWFSYYDIFPVILLLSIVITMGFVVILMLVPDRLFKYAAGFLFAFTFVLYIQGNFLPNNYGVLDGDTIEWKKYEGRFLYNSAIWIVFLSGFVFFAKKNEQKLYSVIKALTGITLATQIVTLSIVGYMLFQNSDYRDDKKNLSTEGEFEVSRNHNTIVFITDCFDAGLFSELLEQYPSDLRKQFEDFTFYPNTVGGATRTKHAIPYIFTGTVNKNQDSYREYVEKSFADSPFIQELSAADYDVRLYTEAAYVDLNNTKVVDNIMDSSLEPVSTWGLAKDFFRLTAFRYAPHAAKKYFWMYSGDFDKWKKSQGDIESYVMNDHAFYNEMQTQKVRCTIEEDVFRFYHLQGAHAPYNLNQNCENIDSAQGNERDQAMGALKIVSEYIQQLKDLGIYENTDVFIMADHGSRHLEQNPLFMVKQSGISQPFCQSEIPLSYQDIPKMFAQTMKREKVDIENEYACSGERYFYVAQEENNKVNMIEYAIPKEAYDSDSIYLTGTVFSESQGQENYEYQIGKELSFQEDATANAYCLSGFSKNEGTHTWTDGTSANMHFELKGKYRNLLLHIGYSVFSPPRKVKVYANGNIIADFDAAGEEEQSIFIPGEYVDDGILDLEFEFPEAMSQEDLIGYGDMRKMTLSMYHLSISSVEEKP